MMLFVRRNDVFHEATFSFKLLINFFVVMINCQVFFYLNQYLVNVFIIIKINHYIKVIYENVIIFVYKSVCFLQLHYMKIDFQFFHYSNSHRKLFGEASVLRNSFGYITKAFSIYANSLKCKL